MAHIDLPEGVPGIVGPMIQYAKTEGALNGLAEALLRGPSPLTTAEREMIASYVSSLNNCEFCMNTHAAVARALYREDHLVVDEVLIDVESAEVSDLMKSLLKIAKRVQQGGRRVTDEDVAKARSVGADDEMIHDTVLIASAFCMFNRYVDGLDTLIPDESTYQAAGSRLASEGYLQSIRRPLPLASGVTEPETPSLANSHNQ